MSYVDVRGANGRFLFKFDPERLLVRMKIRGVVHIVDLTEFIQEPVVELPLDSEQVFVVN